MPLCLLLHTVSPPLIASVRHAVEALGKLGELAVPYMKKISPLLLVTQSWELRLATLGVLCELFKVANAHELLSPQQLISHAEQVVARFKDSDDDVRTKAIVTLLAVGPPARAFGADVVCSSPRFSEACLTLFLSVSVAVSVIVMLTAILTMMLILTVTLSLSLTHILTLHYTCCYDEIKGTQDLKICSHAGSLHDSLSPVYSGEIAKRSIPFGENASDCRSKWHLWCKFPSRRDS